MADGLAGLVADEASGSTIPIVVAVWLGVPVCGVVSVPDALSDDFVAGPGLVDVQDEEGAGLGGDVAVGLVARPDGGGCARIVRRADSADSDDDETQSY